MNLGIGLAREGKKVLLVDVDAQGSLTASLGYTQPDQLSVTLETVMQSMIAIHGFGHYMDDYHGMTSSREVAERHLDTVIKMAEAVGLQVNRNKCHVINLDKPFRFCKAKYRLKETGAVQVHGCRDGMKRARRKLKLFAKKVAAGEKTVREVEAWLQSQIAYYERFNDHGRILRLRRLFHAIIGRYNHV